jgi:hypothetical protein
LVIAGAVAAVTAVIVLALQPEPVVRATLTVKSVPPGATVRIDGTVLPKVTPLEIHDLDPHVPHHLAVSLRGYELWENDVKFEDKHELTANSILTPTVGELEVDSEPRGAEVIVNNRISGVTPTTVHDLPPNEDVHVELRLRGYKAASKDYPWGDRRKLSTGKIVLEKAR